MEVELAPGKYVVAVSGGVDSVVLLDILSKAKNLELVVAHFDHGIRNDSVEDRKFVQNLAKKYDLKFAFKREELGPEASEEKARIRRYKFLEEVLENSSSKAIVTAHHKDDQLETAIFNLLRGTGRSGLTSLKSTKKIARPILSYKKDQLIEYAKRHNLEWREDPSNQSLKYSRNKIRSLLAQASVEKKDQLSTILQKAAGLNLEMDDIVFGLFSHGFDHKKNSFDRQFFISLPHKVAVEVMVYWLKNSGVPYNKKLLEIVVNAAKTSRSGTKLDLDKSHYLAIETTQIGIRNR